MFSKPNCSSPHIYTAHTFCGVLLHGWVGGCIVRGNKKKIFRLWYIYGKKKSYLHTYIHTKHDCLELHRPNPPTPVAAPPILRGRKKSKEKRKKKPSPFSCCWGWPDLEGKKPRVFLITCGKAWVEKMAVCTACWYRGGAGGGLADPPVTCMLRDGLVGNLGT